MSITRVQNNGQVDVKLSDLGINIKVGDFLDIEDSGLSQEDLSTSESFLNSIRSGNLDVLLDNVKLSIRDALTHFTLESTFQDDSNDRWLYSKGEKVRIPRFSQLRISGRCLVLEEGVEIDLGEGSDIVID